MARPYWLAITIVVFLITEFTEASLGNKRHYYKTGSDIARGGNRTIKEPPPHELVAKMARYIVHASGESLPQHNMNYETLGHDLIM